MFLVPAIAAVGVVVALLAVLDPFGEHLGPDELPASISSAHRQDIDRLLQAFFVGVDQHNPQVAGDAMVSPDTMGTNEFARFVVELGVLQSASLTLGYQSLGSTTLDANAGVVHATVVTAVGPAVIDVARRDGRWRVVHAPLLLRAVGGGLPYGEEWELTHSYRSADGSQLVLVGWLHNTGDATWLLQSAAAYIPGPDGRAVTLDVGEAFGNPFVDAADSRPFQVALEVPEGQDVDPSAIVVVPTIRPAREGDTDILAKALSVEPEEIGVADAGAELAVNVTNGEDALRNVTVDARLLDASGRLVGVYRSEATVLDRGTHGLTVPIPADAPVADGERFEVDVWGTVFQG